MTTEHPVLAGATTPAASAATTELRKELREQLALRSMMDDPIAPLLAKLDSALSPVPLRPDPEKAPPVHEVADCPAQRELQAVYGTPDPRDAIAALERSEARADALERDAAIGRLVREKLVSGNAIPVWQCTIRADEVAAIDAALNKSEGR